MHKVTNYREVEYNAETKIDAFHWEDFINEVSCTFFDDGDYYAVYEDLDERSDHERKKYAVYSHDTGDLICLVADSGLVLDGCYDDEEYMWERNKLYKQIAMLAGWPEHINTKAQPYELTITRTINVLVWANNYREAERIGDMLACGETDYACSTINNAILNGDDSLINVTPCNASGFFHLRMCREECEDLLNEGRQQ